MTGVDQAGNGDQARTEQNKRVVRRLVEEVLNAGRVEVLEELYDPRLARAARRWIEPFLASFSDVHMRVEELIAEDDRVVGRFACSGTHTGPWLGHAPTGRRFTDIGEVYVFRLADGRITHAWGLEDTWRRLRQLGLVDG
jgi:predicted ester cyclase